jgi:hypothetical protein
MHEKSKILLRQLNVGQAEGVILSDPTQRGAGMKDLTSLAT